MTRSEMPRPFRQTLAELEMLSHGSTQAWNKSAPPSDIDYSPRGETNPPHLQFRDEWMAAKEDDRHLVEARASKALRELRVRPKLDYKAESPKQRDADMLSRGEGWSPAEVARNFRTTIREVIDVRTANQRDPATGKRWQTEEDPTEQARRLADQGLGVRQIAMYQKVQPSTVSRRLNRAA